MARPNSANLEGREQSPKLLPPGKRPQAVWRSGGMMYDNVGDEGDDVEDDLMCKMKLRI